jgi:hypothetical protein
MSALVPLVHVGASRVIVVVAVDSVVRASLFCSWDGGIGD